MAVNGGFVAVKQPINNHRLNSIITVRESNWRPCLDRWAVLYCIT